jgi:uncharacterized membrane protein (DUF485 family)
VENKINFQVFQIKNFTDFYALFSIMKKITFLVLTLIFFLIQNVSAQSTNPDFARSIGKIYVVVGVILTIFISLVIYLIRLDKKLTKLENQIKENE